MYVPFKWVFELKTCLSSCWTSSLNWKLLSQHSSSSTRIENIHASKNNSFFFNSSKMFFSHLRLPIKSFQIEEIGGAKVKKAYWAKLAEFRKTSAISSIKTFGNFFLLEDLTNQVPFYLIITLGSMSFG